MVGEDDMSDPEDFKVFKGDLFAAAKVFHQVAGDYKGAMPNAGFVPATGGDPGFDKMLDAALRTIGEMHLILAQAVDQHGRKLGFAADAFGTTEGDITATVNQVLQKTRLDSPPPLDTPPSFE
jgi:hypothetical protein